MAQEHGWDLEAWAVFSNHYHFVGHSHDGSSSVHHGLVPVANQYRWCSAAWFEQTATPAQVATIYSFKIDRVKVHDDFDVE